MKTEARSSNERIVVMAAVKAPTSLKNCAKLISVAHGAVGTHQTSALKHAIECGAYLHWAKAQVEHGKWLLWLRENFAGSETWAERYMRIARAYSADTPIFNGCDSISDALQIARELPKAGDLPTCLPGLMDPPVLRAVQTPPEPVQQAPDDPGADGEPLDDGLHWTQEEIEEDLRQGYARQAQRKKRTEAAEQVRAASDALVKRVDPYIASLEALDAISRAQGALNTNGYKQLADDMRDAHRRVRTIISKLHSKDASHV